MPKSLGLLALGGLVCLWPAAAAADGQYGRPLGHRPPSGLIHVAAGGESLIVWPYTTDDFTQPSDPIDLIFPNADPRAIRQELMKLEGDRPEFEGLSIKNCRWTDAMGDEQAAFGRPERGVGGAVQLACAPAGAPLGIDFRVHIRLFRIGKDTIGGVHLDFLIPGTAEHETLSWDFPRAFVAYDMGRTGTVVAPAKPVTMIQAGTFRGSTSAGTFSSRGSPTPCSPCASTSPRATSTSSSRTWSAGRSRPSRSAPQPRPLRSGRGVSSQPREAKCAFAASVSFGTTSKTSPRTP